MIRNRCCVIRGACCVTRGLCCVRRGAWCMLRDTWCVMRYTWRVVIRDACCVVRDAWSVRTQGREKSRGIYPRRMTDGKRQKVPPSVTIFQFPTFKKALVKWRRSRQTLMSSHFPLLEFNFVGKKETLLEKASNAVVSDITVFSFPPYAFLASPVSSFFSLPKEN